MTADTEWSNRIESSHVDKSEWYRGPWDEEPDRVEWRFHGTPRFALLIVRGPSGGLCGYVGLPPGHPFHGAREYGAYSRLDLDVHGGLTFGGACQEGGHICHVPRAGESPDVTWLGFDCAHCYDYSSMSMRKYDEREGRSSFAPSWHESYRDLHYVRREVESLAEQCARVAKGLPPRDDVAPEEQNADG